MRVSYSAKRLVALILAGAAVLAAIVTSPGAVGTRAVAATRADQSYREASPPILPVLRPSELAQLRRLEARERAAFYYRVPANARYSDVEMNAFARKGR